MSAAHVKNHQTSDDWSIMTAEPEPHDTTILGELYERPGFMIRRAHQIATSIFMEVAAPVGATTTQYGVLTILSACPGVDQISLARRMGLDRSTAGTVLQTLERDGYVLRVVGSDRRRRSLELTEAGRKRLAMLQECAAEALTRLLMPLTPMEATSLCALLAKLTQAHNKTSRVPISD